MKIIHGIHNKETLQATLSADLYRGSVDTEGNYPGCRCEILITTTDPFTGETEPIYIEGSAEDVHYALSLTLSVLEKEMAHKREVWEHNKAMGRLN